MAIFLCSALLVALQGPPAADSLDAWWRRVAADSADAAAWVAIGHAYAARAAAYHREHPAGGARGAAIALDTAAAAFGRAAARPPGPARDSALAYAAFTWGEATLLAWEVHGLEALVAAGAPEAARLRLPPVLSELGENLLRACPAEGVLLTAGDVDTYAAWFLRLGRHLRPDVIVIPLAIWEADAVFRERVASDLQLPDPDDAAATWRALAGRRPVCASTAFERPPLASVGLNWRAAPLVWVAGPARVGSTPATDFVFEAARLAHTTREAWADDVIAVYRRAAALTRSLCSALAAFNLAEATGCGRAG
jgi:hypothetical protein